MATQDVNLNSSHCLQTVNDLGVQHIHNICSGVVTDMPWGTMDWLLVGCFSLFAIVVIALFGGMAYGIIRDSL